MKPALLVIDIQNAWLAESKDLKSSVEKRMDTINQAIRWFRKKHLPVIVISHEDKKSGAVPGSKSFEFAKIVEVLDSDIWITKRYPNSFAKTSLRSVLEEHGCDTVLIVGLSASGCALATCFGAVDNDLNAYFVKDGVASHSEEHVRFAEEICGTLEVSSLDKTMS